MLAIICGDFESFSQYNDTFQDNYLWTCSKMMREIVDHREHPDEHLKESEVMNDENQYSNIDSDAVLISDPFQVKVINAMRKLPEEKQEKVINLFKALFVKQP